VTLRPLCTAVALLALALAVPASARAQCAGADAIPAPGSLDRSRSATLCLINAQRTSRGLQPLHDDGRLRAAAEDYSRQMVRHDFFAHVSAVDGSTFASRVRASHYLRGARSWRIGENLAWGSGSYATPRATIRAWMRSPGHRANVLTPGFREVGLGIVAGAPTRVHRRAATYTADFGTRT
jgi:uncharacterized protein YkwD